jgi:hypothetical protein
MFKGFFISKIRGQVTVFSFQGDSDQIAQISNLKSQINSRVSSLVFALFPTSYLCHWVDSVVVLSQVSEFRLQVQNAGLDFKRI